MKVKHHETAGGVVIDQSGCMLVIVRDIEREGRLVHEVRLPKGHIDLGETAEQADLGACRSTFTFRDRLNERDERYFLMRLIDPYRGAPRPTGREEALFQPEWIEPATAAAQLTYESEREFARRSVEALHSML